MAKKANRPSSFRHNGIRWTIRWIPDRGENLGETHHDKNEVRIFAIDDVPEGSLRETLHHELMHVALVDITTILDTCNASAHDKEEAIIRISSPRQFAIYTENKSLRKYVFGD